MPKPKKPAPIPDIKRKKSDPPLPPISDADREATLATERLAVDKNFGKWWTGRKMVFLPALANEFLRYVAQGWPRDYAAMRAHIPTEWLPVWFEWARKKKKGRYWEFYMNYCEAVAIGRGLSIDKVVNSNDPDVQLKWLRTIDPRTFGGDQANIKDLIILMARAHNKSEDAVPVSAAEVEKYFKEHPEELEAAEDDDDDEVYIPVTAKLLKSADDE